MDRVEFLKQSTSAPIVLYKEFLALSARSNLSPICFFEGDSDVIYYSSRIEQIYKSSWDKIVCRGKTNLLGVKDHIASAMPNYGGILLFFIDRDFDFDLRTSVAEKLYVTPCYSIENMFVNLETFTKYIHRYQTLRKGADPEKCDVSKCIEVFERVFQEFLQAVDDLNCWIFRERSWAKAYDLERLPLSSLKIKDYIKITLTEVSFKCDLFGFLEQNKIVPRVDLSCSRSTKEAFDALISNGPRESVYRGKHLKEFLLLFETRIAEESKKSEHELFSKEFVFKQRLDSNNFFGLLNDIAQTPLCLTNFLQETLGSAVRE